MRKPKKKTNGSPRKRPVKRQRQRLLSQEFLLHAGAIAAVLGSLFWICGVPPPDVRVLSLLVPLLK